MEKIDFLVLLCAMTLCFQIKPSEQSQPLNCNVSVTVFSNRTQLPPKYNDDGVLQVEPGQGISFRVASKSVPHFTFSPNLEISTRKDVRYTDINDPKTYVAHYTIFVRVGVNHSGWFDAVQCNVFPRRNDNSSTVFFSSEILDKSGKKFADSGSTIQLKDTAPRHVVPCRATNKNVLPTLRLISPAVLRNDNFTADKYDPKIGFQLPWIDESFSPARTFECAVDEEKVTVEFPEIDYDFFNQPEIWMTESSNEPKCSVRRSADLTAEKIACNDPHHCDQLVPYLYQPLPQPGLMVDQCTNCLDVSVPLIKGPTNTPIQTMRIDCHANGMSTPRDVVRGLDGVYYFGDRLSKKPEATIRAKEISREGSKITVGMTVLRYQYFPVKDVSISFKNGSTEFIDESRMSQSFDQGIQKLAVTVNLNENMDKIIFHAFQLNTMKLTNVSVDLSPAANFPRGVQQEN